MYDGFLKVYDDFKKHEVENPLIEKNSPSYLKPQGILVFEIGAGQENLVTRIMEKSGSYNKIEYFDDGEQIRAVSAVCK